MSSMIGASSRTPNVSNVPGTGYKQVNLQVDPRTQALWQQLQGGASGGIDAGLGQLSQLAAGGNEDFWDQLEAPAIRQLGQFQGQAASRFSNMGSGARRSSGFQNTLGAAGADLAEKLQSNRVGMQQNAIRDLLGLGQNLLQTNLSDTALVPKKKPWWQELLIGLNNAGSQAAGTLGGLGLSKAAGFI